VLRRSLQAARAYDIAARQLHGEFASLNFPDEVITEWPKPANCDNILSRHRRSVLQKLKDGGHLRVIPGKNAVHRPDVVQVTLEGHEKEVQYRTFRSLLDSGWIEQVAQEDNATYYEITLQGALELTRTFKSQQRSK
jgi:hypothetical protein